MVLLCNMTEVERNKPDNWVLIQKILTLRFILLTGARQSEASYVIAGKRVNKIRG